MAFRDDTVRVEILRPRWDRLWRIVSNDLFGTDFSETKVVRGRLLDPPPRRGGSSSSGGSGGGGSSGGRSGGVPDIEDVGVIQW